MCRQCCNIKWYPQKIQLSYIQSIVLRQMYRKWFPVLAQAVSTDLCSLLGKCCKWQQMHACSSTLWFCICIYRQLSEHVLSPCFDCWHGHQNDTKQTEPAIMTWRSLYLHSLLIAHRCVSVPRNLTNDITGLETAKCKRQYSCMPLVVTKYYPIRHLCS